MCERCFNLEKEKMLYFLLTYTQNIVLVKTGQKQEEKAFLGYEFSERRGHEGIKHLPNGTKLFDENGDLLNPQKANSYIYNAFLDKEVSIDESLARNVSYGRMSEFINYGTIKFDKVVNLNNSVKNKLQNNFTSYNSTTIGECVEVKGGKRLAVGETFSAIKTNHPYIRVANFKFKSIDDTDLRYITEKQHKKIKNYTISSEDVYISIAGTLGIVGKIPNNLSGANLTENAAKLIPNKSRIDRDYLISILDSDYVQEQIVSATVGTGTPKLSLQRIKSLKIPLPPLEVQRKIVAEIKGIEGQIQQSDSHITELYQQLESIFDDSDDEAAQTHLGQIVNCNPSKSELASIPDDTIISFVEMASVSNNGYIATIVNRPLNEVRKGSYTYFRENDIIIAKITPCMENGKCALATNLSNNIGMGSSEFHVFRCDDTVIPRYLLGYLNRRVIREEAEKRMTGSSGHRRVPISFYEQLPIRLPPLNKQKTIVAEIEKIEAKINDIQAKLTDLKAAKDGVLLKYL